MQAVMKEPKSYEAISPETVQRKRHLIIDKYTGKAALKNKLEGIGIRVRDQELDSILKEIKSQPEKIMWGDKELISLTNSIKRKV